MNHRERTLAGLAGQPADRIPWTPRLDLWYIALKARGTVPPEFDGLNTAEMAEALGVGCHAVRADYTLAREPEENLLRGLGFENHPDYPYRVEVRGLKTEFDYDAENLRTVFHTSAGDVTTHLESSLAMQREGVSIPFVRDYPITSAADFDAVGELFEHLEVVPTPDCYAAFHARVGERGVAVANGLLGASPIHLMLHDLVAMDQFYYLYHDEREAIERLAQRMTPFYEACVDALVACEAEAVFWGANYDRDLTWPPFFAEQIAPWLRRVAERAHAAGKYLVTHADGENEKLMEHFVGCGFDAAESVCVAPMTKYTLAEQRAGMGPDITVWGGIPSVALLPQSMNEREFEVHLDEVFGQLGSGERLVLGVSDNVPADADLSRLRRITERVEAFGPVQS